MKGRKYTKNKRARLYFKRRGYTEKRRRYTHKRRALKL